MALNYGESLRILGISHTSSDNEVELAYRDLMRVWHPDRFATDERLHRKAEDETKRINEAIDVVRAYRASGASWSEPHGAADDSQQRRSKETRSTDATQSTWSQTAAAAAPVAPLMVHQRKRASFFRCVAGGCALFVGYRGLHIFQGSSFEGAFATLVIFSAIYVIIRDSFLLVTRLPIISATRQGLYLLGVGLLPWEHVQELESHLRSHSLYLGVTASDSYVTSQGLFTKLLLKLNQKRRAAHYMVPFVGLTAHPNKVVTTAKSFLAREDAVSSPRKRSRRARNLLLLIWWLQATCIFIAIEHWLFNRNPHPKDCLVCFQLFAFCQLVSLIIARREALRFSPRPR
jgi:hypothetical protein